MDAFVKFLLDYYIWILAVLGIVIVTIIGFLVDSKQKRKKKELETDKLSKVDKPSEDVTTINAQNSVPVVDAISQTVPNIVDNVVGNDSSDIYSLNNNVQVQEQNAGILSNQTSVQNNNSDVSLSGQKPHFEPRDVNVPVSQQPVNSNLNNQIVVPQPVNAVPINQPVSQPVYSGATNSSIVYQNSNPSSGIYSNQQYMHGGAVGMVSNVQPVYQNNINNQMQVQPTVDTTSIVSTNNLSNPIGNVQPFNSNIQNSAIQTQSLDNSVNGNMNFVTSEQQPSNSDDMWKL